ncbi:MAG TPA: adenylate/guanylate cyclase domain-containing protein [Syntrophomonas sp.]|nr:adenylate/guanylate cyclase domain-containing protein [Syntrophomonas sp.]HRW11817.1 adenylate/guanylate cyclase domain-containing protein [Syntrophomonas sp.]
MSKRNNAPAATAQEFISSQPVTGWKQWRLPFFILLLLQAVVLLGVLERPEMSLYDAWFRLQGAADPGQQVVVAAMDESSIDRLGPPAWPRSVHAQLLEKLVSAKIVAFDLTFGAAKDAEQDLAFAEAIAQHGNVVLISKFYFEKDEDGDVVQIPELPLEELAASAAGMGFANMPTDPDQVVRHTTLVDTNSFDIPYPSFATAIILAAQDLNYEDLELGDGYLQAGQYKVPLDSRHQAMTTFWGPRGTFQTISYADILEEKISPAYFQDKIVLVGSTTQDEHDYFATPYTTSNMVKSGALETPGVEVHAAVVQSYLNQSWYQRVGRGLNFLFLLLLTLLTVKLVAGRGPLAGLLGVLGVSALTLLTVFVLWKNHWWLDLASPLALIFLLYVVVTASDFVRAEMQRRKTKALFSRYVSADVVEQLMADPAQMALGGKKQLVTVMFADIRGFTAFSENKDPVEVIHRLNEYLTVMTESILKHGGTLDKYLGDGLMAFFGAPIYYPDHVERSILVAREIQQKVAELNRQWETKGEVPLLVAVGINTGPAVVGNVGSPERMDYTLIGEDVNLASRVEALTKLFSTLVLVSERSYHLLADGPVKDSLAYVGEELVKGFTHPIKVYTFTDLDLHFEKSTDSGFK